MLLQISALFLFAAVLLVSISTSSAFTPDAAYRMKSLGIAPGGGAKTGGVDASKIMRTSILSQAANGNDRRKMQLSLIGQENRKSITVPPSYEDFMAVRRRSLMGLLGRKD